MSQKSASSSNIDTEADYPIRNLTISFESINSNMVLANFNIGCHYLLISDAADMSFSSEIKGTYDSNTDIATFENVNISDKQYLKLAFKEQKDIHITPHLEPVLTGQVLSLIYPELTAGETIGTTQWYSLSESNNWGDDARVISGATNHTYTATSVMLADI